MNKVESHIKEELGKFIIDLALSRVDHWAKNEINYIRHALDYPVVIPLNDKNWVIGNFYIKHLGPHKYQVIKNNTNLHTFYSKKAAIFYVVFEKMKFYNPADSLLEADILVGRLHNDLEFYTSKLTKRSVAADGFKLQLWETRHSEIKAQFISARQELEKRLNSAKYYKIWEKII